MPTLKVGIETLIVSTKPGYEDPRLTQLVNNFAGYEHSSASFYKKGIKKYEKLVNINCALDNLIPGSHSAQSPAMKTPG